MPLTPASPEFLDTLAKALPKGCLQEAEPRYLEEPRGRWHSSARFVVKPNTTKDVALCMKACNSARVGLVPYGGGTGLVGGQTPDVGPAPLLLSLERMNRIRATHAAESAMIVEAGAVLQNVQQAAEEAGLLFPLSLASEGTAQIGGLLATNAGGVNVLRYGNARDQVLGLEAVLPNGDIWHGLKRLRKDNTGYDLRHLLIGSEGSLGVITAASLKLSPIPASSGTALLSVRDPAAALSLLGIARQHVGEGVSAFEMMHREGFAFLAETLPQVRQPWSKAPEWCMLIELGLGAGQSPDDALAAIFEEAQEAGLVSDGLIAQSKGQAQDFWAMREHIPLANRAIGAISSHDISLPLGALAAFVEQAKPALEAIGTFRINCFGHLGDGNLHYNVFPIPGESRALHEDKRDAIKACVHDLVHSFGGSVSAEHGIGRLKTGDLEKYGDPTKLAAMRAIKAALDPNGICNPGAVLRKV